jgi:hypothetical protein
LVVALDKGGENEAIKVLGLPICGEARIEVGGVRFDEEDKRRAGGFGRGAALKKQQKAKAIEKEVRISDWGIGGDAKNRLRAWRDKGSRIVAQP